MPGAPGGTSVGIVGRAHDLAVDLGVEHRQHLAAPVGLDQERAELVAEPQRVADRLDRFDVEIRAGQVALGRVLVDDAERHLAVGIAQERGRDVLDRARLPVRLHHVEHQHGVGRVGLRAEAVVGKREERTVLQVLDTRQSLHRLALERQADAGRPRRRLVGQRGDARHAFGRVDPLARRSGKAAGDLQVGRRIGGRGNEGHGRQDRVTFQHRRELGLRRRRHREAKGGRRRDREEHMGSHWMISPCSMVWELLHRRYGLLTQLVDHEQIRNEIDIEW